MSRSSWRRVAGAAAVAIMGAGLISAPAQAAPADKAVKDLTKAVTLQGVLRHLVAFQGIAELNDGNRASGSRGYDRSADYVAGLMRLAGYKVSKQAFPFTFCTDTGSSFSQNAPTPTTYTDQVDYDVLDCSGGGSATGAVVPVDLQLTTPNTSTSGCEASDFTPAVAGNIALVQRGTCNFGVKVANAEAAGAIGAVMMNQGNADTPDRQDLFFGTLGDPVGIPAVSVSYPLGVQFANTPGLNLTVSAEAVAEVKNTTNVIAETKTGDPNNVVMVGAHLDSEPDTAGINDNGTGSAGILEVAWQARNLKPTNKIRYAWWGAEESGLVGSTFYVDSLTEAQRAKIALYLNFDMIGSPNYTFGVYDGDDSAGEGSGPGPDGSAQIETVFEDFFASRGEPTAAADFSGRSDYGPFIATGIPAGGLFTGAEGIKTEQEAADFGGIAGEAYDPCYHAPCDSLTPVRDGADADLYRRLRAEYQLAGNVNKFALHTNADAIAAAVALFATDTSMIPPRTAAATQRKAAAAPATAKYLPVGTPAS